MFIRSVDTFSENKYNFFVPIANGYGTQLLPIEIKSSQTFTPSFLKGLKYFKQLVGERCDTGYLIYAGQQTQKLGEFHLINFRQLNEIPE